ncbi:tetratricopeptide repeat protein [Tautonia rosea]|uniref:tetratricopeptide repeat protein n=1 Tax=Tautonia rosea TaxID=2728037 RepID=UPI0014732B17|nr:tetratricopeptide repeat protein [Tautonia rosea]
MARSLLEQGQGELAWETLAARVRPDAEAHWLLSRAALQRGDLQTAESALSEARTLGFDDDPMRVEPAVYVGSDRCVSCHGEIGRDQQTSHHASTFTGVADLDQLPIPDEPLADPEDPEVIHSFRRDGDQIIVETSVADERFELVLSHLMGSGHHGFTPVGIDRFGNVVELRLSHYAGDVGWDLTTGHLPRPGFPSEFLGRPLPEHEQQSCLNCHTTHLQTNSSPPQFTVLEGGVRCERCHGPGGNHLAAVEGGFSEPAIVRPRLGSANQVVNLCADCHRASESGPQDESSNPFLVRFQATTFVRSACYTQSPTSAKFDCVSCHNPHRNVETNPTHYDTVCLSCHSDSRSNDFARASRQPQDLASTLFCPIETTQSCVTCHMPPRESSMRHTRFTDHHIRVQADLEGLDLTDPRAEE